MSVNQISKSQPNEYPGDAPVKKDKPSQTNAASVPSIHQYSINDLPEEVIGRVMEWSIFSSLSAANARHLGATSKKFRSHRETCFTQRWYRDFMSAMSYKKNVAEIAISKLSDWERIPSPTEDGLCKLAFKINKMFPDLKSLSDIDEFLNVNKKARTEFDKTCGKDALEKIQAYRGNSFCCLISQFGSMSAGATSILNEALHPEVWMDMSIFEGGQLQVQSARNFYSALSRGNRMLSLEFKRFGAWSAANREDTFDFLDRSVMTPYVEFDIHESSDTLLELSSRVGEFRGIQVLVLDFASRWSPDKIKPESMLAFVDALTNRQKNGLPPIVVIAMGRDPNIGIEAQLFSSRESRAMLEKLQFYFVHSKEVNKSSKVNKIYDAIRTNCQLMYAELISPPGSQNGSSRFIKRITPTPPTPPTSQSGDAASFKEVRAEIDDASDSIIDSVDDESWCGSEFEDDENIHRPVNEKVDETNSPREFDATSEPRVKKRDKRNKCVIS